MRLLESLLLKPPRLASAVLFVLAALVIAAGAWSYLTRVDVTVTARGVVRPKGEVVRIVAEAGGKITRLHMEERQTVRRGDLLVGLDTRDSELRRRAIEERIHALEARRQDLERRVQNLLAVYATEDRELALQLETLLLEGEMKEARLQKRKVEQAVLLESAKREVERASTRNERAGQLLGLGLVSRAGVEEARSAADQARANFARVDAASPDPGELRLHAAQLERVLEAREQKFAEFVGRRNELESDLPALESQLRELYSQLEQEKVLRERLFITSPADGRIAAASALHVGEIVSAGSLIATIDPAVSRLVIESWLSPADANFVREGQSVRIRDTSGTLRYNLASGKVASVSPDVHPTGSNQGVHRVHIVPASQDLPLRLGLTFEIHFVTRHERILSLVVDRFRKELPYVY